MFGGEDSSEVAKAMNLEYLNDLDLR